MGACVVAAIALLAGASPAWAAADPARRAESVASAASGARADDLPRLDVKVAPDVSAAIATLPEPARAPMPEVATPHAAMPTSAGPAIGAEQVQSSPGSSDVAEYYGYDALGSVRVVFDAAGNVTGQATYAPYGQEVYGATGLPSQRFTGQERDHEAGLDYFNARSYQVRTGRFGTVDPLFGGAIGDPQSWNRYAYALGNPLGIVDTNGMNPQAITCKQTDAEKTLCSGYSETVDVSGGGVVNFVSAEYSAGTGLSSGGFLGGGRVGAGGTPPATPQTPLAPLSPKDQTKVDDAVTKLEEYAPTKSCQDQVIAKIGNGFSFSGFQAYIGNGAGFYDGTASSAPISGAIYPSQAGAAFMTGNPGVTSVADYFRAKPGLNAMTSMTAPTLTVFLRPSALGSNARNFALVWHEGLHGYGGNRSGFDDDALMNGFGLSGASVEISRHIQKNCK
jgi:RHS repeat-associated protein